jgi:hypothetical protein
MQNEPGSEVKTLDFRMRLAQYRRVDFLPSNVVAPR